MSTNPRTPRANKPSKSKAVGHDPEVDDFLLERRLRRLGYKLPQRCPPAEKLAALEKLAELSGIQPIDDPRSMIAGFWPANEDADTIIAAIRNLRRQRR
jgi:hypothetical protein